ILVTLAYLALDLVSRLSLHPPRRQPARQSLREPAPGVHDLRSVARRRHPLHHLGCDPRRRAVPREILRPVSQPLADGDSPRDDADHGHRGLGLFPARHRSGPPSPAQDSHARELCPISKRLDLLCRAAGLPIAVPFDRPDRSLLSRRRRRLREHRRAWPRPDLCDRALCPDVVLLELGAALHLYAVLI